MSSLIRDWYNKAFEARTHYDAVPAWNALKDWTKRSDEFKKEIGSDVALQKKIDCLLEQLSFVAFAELPIENAKKILNQKLLEFIQSDIDIKDCFEKRFLNVGFGNWETERLELQDCVLKNNEKFGALPLGQWVSSFEKGSDSISEGKDSYVPDFIIQNSSIAALSKTEQDILKKLMEAYELYLMDMPISIFDLVDMKRKSGISSDSFSMKDRNLVDPKSSRSSDRLPLLKALSEYPRLGDQNITANRIKTKQAPEPVRGSLTNWIHYYRDELGIGFHDQVKRGQFLFQSENGKRLSGEERERLNLILKSIEEEFPLDIDTARQEIVFPAITIPQSNQIGGAPVRGAASFPIPQTPTSASKQTQAFSAPIFQGGMNQPSGVPSRGVNPWVIQPPTSLAPRPSLTAQPKASFGGTQRPVSPSSAAPSLGGNMKPIENIANHTVEFSTGHVLPAEKASQETRAVTPAASVPVATGTGGARFGTGQRISNPTNQSRSPYSIRPFRSRSDKP